jgi:hypothetical protein
MSADAGAEDDAAVEPPIPTRCTAAECCSEALAAGAPEDDKNSAGGKGEKAGAKTAAKSPGKSCGCSDPALLQTVACAVLGPLGVLL